MSLNRYRLKHLAEKNHGGAVRAVALLSRPDKLITLILLGNNFINILITQLATYIGYRLYGEAGIAIAAGLLTLILLLFAEVRQKVNQKFNTQRTIFFLQNIVDALEFLFFMWISGNQEQNHRETFQPGGFATLIGSLPLADHGKNGFPPTTRSPVQAISPCSPDSSTQKTIPPP